MAPLVPFLSDPDTRSAELAYGPFVRPGSGTARHPAPSPKGDTVEISISAQVLTMKREGLPVASIAAALGLTSALVNSDLGILSIPVTSSTLSNIGLTANAASSTSSN